MTWACPADRAPLEANDESLLCPACGASYPRVDGIPLFARETEEQRPAPELDELWQAMQSDEAAGSVEAFCSRRRCARSSYSADWKFFFSIPDGGTTLELGAGFGDDSVDLAGAHGTTLAVVPDLTSGRIVRRNVLQRAGREQPVAVLRDLTRLPLADGSVDAIALEDAAAPAFGLTRAVPDEVAAEWSRVLAPGGVVFLGLANGLYRLPGFEQVRRRLRTRERTEALNRRVKRWAAADARPALGVRRTIRTLRSNGFEAPVVYAPLPDENDTQVVIPVEESQVVRYFLNNLIRKNSPWVRGALRVAHTLVTLGLFGRVVPYYFLIFRKTP